MAKPPPVPDKEDLKRRLQRAFEDHRKAIAGAGILLVVLAVFLILWIVTSRQARTEQWEKLQKAATSSAFDAESTLEDLGKNGAEAVRMNAMLSLAVSRYENRRYDEALEALDAFDREYGSSFLAGLPSPDRRYSLAEELRTKIEAEIRWEKTYRFEDPDPDTTRVALIETTKGDIWIGFYPDHAPKHVESFVAHAKAGDFNNVQVYAVKADSIDAGGVTTRDDDPANDAEPEMTGLLQPERGRFWIEQRQGRVSSVAYPGGESPLRITIVTSPTGATNLNKSQTIFAEVLRDRGTGLEAVDAIRNVTTYGSSGRPEYQTPDYAELQDHPVEPVVIERVSIWKDDKIEEGHAWDTSAVTPPETTVARPPAEDSTEGAGNAKEAGEDGGDGDGEETGGEER